MNVDRAVVTRAAQTGEVTKLLSRGVTADLFAQTPDGQECAEAFSWMAEFNRRYNEAPSQQLFRERFPNWMGEPSSDPVEALADQFLAHVKRRLFSKKISELVKYEGNPAMWGQLDQLLLDAARDLSAIVPSGEVAKYSDMTQRVQTYDDERRDPSIRRSLKMGIPPFDEATNGMRPGNLVTIAGFSGLGKALALDTPVPTPSGWTTMGEVKKGDVVFGADGRPTLVREAWPVLLGRKCYEVGFSDGSTIIADGEHKWLTHYWNARGSEAWSQKLQGKRSAGNDQKHKRVLPSVVTTEQIRDDLLRDPRKHSIPCSSPVEYLERDDLLIDPYVFGYWLGDGTSNCAEITVGHEDREHLLRELDKAGYKYTVHEKRDGNSKVSFGHLASCKRGHRGDRIPSGRCRECQRIANDAYYYKTELPPLTHFTVQEKLRHIGALGNKRIPERYATSSVDQRMSLLQGIVDSDGTFAESNGRCDIEMVQRELMEDVLALCLSLGFRATWTEREATLNGRVVGRRYKVGFTTDKVIARLPRKISRIPSQVGTRATHRYIDYVREVASVPVRCIAVEADDHQFLVGDTYIPTHNSLLSQWFVMNAMEQDARSLILSLEMTKEEVLERLDTMLMKFSYKLLGARELPDSDVEKWRNVSRQFAGMQNDIFVKDKMWGCVHGDTLVHTRSGLRRAVDLENKTVDILASDGQYRPATWMSFGRQKLYRVEFSTGESVLATANHQWIVSRIKPTTGPDRVPVRNERILTPELVGRRVPLRTTETFDYDEEEYTIGVRNGLIWGDGTRRYQKHDDGSWTIRSQAEGYGPEAKEILERWFDGVWSNQREGFDCVIRSGMQAPELKDLPPAERSPSWMRGFIAGAIASDGHCDKRGSACIYQSSKEDLEYIRYIAGAAGMACTGIRLVRDVSPLDGRPAELWSIQLAKESFFLEGGFDERLLLKPSHRRNFLGSSQRRRQVSVEVVAVEELDREEEVYCCIEPTTRSWTLGSGIVTGNCTVDHVYAEINRYKPDITVVDYVQLMKTQTRGAQQWQTMVEVTNALKQIALATDSVIVMVSQDGRDAAENGSTMQNMGGSISVYQAADIYIGLHQSDDMYQSGRMEVRLLKARRGERKPKAYLEWEPATMNVRYIDENEPAAAQFVRAA